MPPLPDPNTPPPGFVNVPDPSQPPAGFVHAPSQQPTPAGFNPIPDWQNDAFSEISRTPGLDDAGKMAVVQKHQNAAAPLLNPQYSQQVAAPEGTGNGATNALVGGVAGGALSVYGAVNPTDAAALQQGVQLAYPYDPANPVNNLASGIGGGLLAAPAMIAGGPVGAAVLGGVQGVGGARMDVAQQRADGREISGGQELASAALHGIKGAGEAYLQGKLIPGAAGVAGPIVNPVARAAAVVGVDALGNAAMAAPSQVASNLIDRATGVHPERDVLEGAGRAAIEGAGAGLAFAPISAVHANGIARQNVVRRTVGDPNAQVYEPPQTRDVIAATEVARAATGKDPVWYASASPRVAFVGEDGVLHLNGRHPGDAAEEAYHALYRGDLKPDLQKVAGEAPDVVDQAAENYAGRAEDAGEQGIAHRVRDNPAVRQDEGIANAGAAAMTPDAIESLAKSNPNAFVRVAERVLGTFDKLAGTNTVRGRIAQRRYQQFIEPLRQNLDAVRQRLAQEGAARDESTLDRLEPQFQQYAEQDQQQHVRRDVLAEERQLDDADQREQAIADERRTMERFLATTGQISKPHDETLQAREGDVPLADEGRRLEQIHAEQPSLQQEDAEAARRARALDTPPDQLAAMPNDRLRQTAQTLGLTADTRATTIPRIREQQERARLMGMGDKALWDAVRARGLKAGRREENIQTLLDAPPPPPEPTPAAPPDRTLQPQSQGDAPAPAQGQSPAAGGDGIPREALKGTPYKNKPQVQRPEGFTRTALTKRMLDAANTEDAGQTADRYAKASDEGRGDPFLFRDKLPTEVRRFLEGRPEARKLFRVAQTHAESLNAGGADTLSGLGDDAYFQLAERMSKGRMGSAVESARGSNDPALQFAAHVYDNQSPATVVEGRSSTRHPDAHDQVAVPADKLEVGHVGKIEGLEFRVTDGPDGERVLRWDGKDYPLDALDKVPVDTGSLRTEDAPAQRPTPGDDVPFSVRKRREEEEGGLFSRPSNSATRQPLIPPPPKPNPGESYAETYGPRWNEAIKRAFSEDPKKFKTVLRIDGDGAIVPKGRFSSDDYDALTHRAVDIIRQDLSPAAAPTDLFGRDVITPATGNQQGRLFHEPTTVKPATAADDARDARIRAKFKDGEGATGTMFSVRPPANYFDDSSGSKLEDTSLWWQRPDGSIAAQPATRKAPAHALIPEADASKFRGRIDHQQKLITVLSLGNPKQGERIAAALERKYPGYQSAVYGKNGEPVHDGAAFSVRKGEEDERIKAAAYRTPDGRVYTGETHVDALDRAGIDTDSESFYDDNAPHDPIAGWDEGFITSSGRFVDRSEASAIARRQGVNSRVIGDGKLSAHDFGDGVPFSVRPKAAETAAAPAESAAEDEQRPPLARVRDRAAQAARAFRDYTTVSPLPRLSRAAAPAADAAVEHASARVAAPFVVKDLMGRVFPDSFKDAAATRRVMDSLVKDNVLGGYDSFRGRADQARTVAEEATHAARDALLKWRELRDAPPDGLTPADVGRLRAKYARDVKSYRKLAGQKGREATQAADAMRDIENAHDVFGYENDVRAAAEDPATSAAIDRWKEHVNPLLDQLYNEMKRVDPNADRDGRGRHFDARVNLLSKAEAAKWAESAADPDKPIPEPSASNYRNPNVKRDPFDRAARFTGDYDTDPATNLTAVLTRRMNEVSKLRFYDALKKSGVAAELEPGQDAPAQIQGQEVARLPVKVPETNPETGVTRLVERSLAVRRDLAGEVRRVLDTDQRLSQNPVAQALTKAQLFQLSDAVTHGKNIFTRVYMSQGAGSGLYDVAKANPVVGIPATLAKIYKSWREIGSDTPAIRAELADMAQKGLIRPSYNHGEFLKKVADRTGRDWVRKLSTGEMLHDLDSAARLILNRQYTELVRQGRAADTDGGRREFVNTVGQYNARLMGPLMRAARDAGLSPFIVAGRNFNRNAADLITGESRIAGDAGQRRRARLTQLGMLASLAMTAPLINMITTGTPAGRSGTPLGAIDLGADDADGTHKVWDVLQIAGVRRGLKSTGLDALGQGLLEGKDANSIGGSALVDAAQARLHPWVGPAPSFAFKALTGRQLDIRGKMEAHTIPGGGAMQYLENLRAATESQNPLVYALVRPAFQAAGLDQKPQDEDQGYAAQLAGTVAKSPFAAAGIKDVRPGKDAAEELADRLAKQHLGDAGMTPEDDERYALRSKLTAQLRGDPDAGEAAIEKAVADDRLSEREAANIHKKVGMSALAWNVRSLSAEDAARVYAAAGDTEREQLRKQVSDKILGSKDLTNGEQDDLLAKLEIDPPPDLAVRRQYHALSAKARAFAAARQKGDRAGLRANRMTAAEQQKLARLTEVVRRIDQARSAGAASSKITRLVGAA